MYLLISTFVRWDYQFRRATQVLPLGIIGYDVSKSVSLPGINVAVCSNLLPDIRFQAKAIILSFCEDTLGNVYNVVFHMSVCLSVCQ
jgi:hypothetical protein